MADSKLKEFPAGRKFLNEVENGTVRVFGGQVFDLWSELVKWSWDNQKEDLYGKITFASGGYTFKELGGYFKLLYSTVSGIIQKP